MTEIEIQEQSLDLARSGDPETIASLYERYGAAVFRVAYRLMGTTEDAEDVLQDVFLGLPEALKSYASRGSLEGWIKQVAARTALMRLRARKTRREASLDEMASIPGATSPGSPIDRVALEEAVKTLTPIQRTVFILKEVEGYGHADIGEMLGISITASKIRLFRARKRLMKYLEV